MHLSSFTNTQRPYQVRGDAYPYPFHVRIVRATRCGRICIGKRKINLSQVLTGQILGLREVDDQVWLVSFMDYDLGYIDLEQRTLQTIDNPFGSRLPPMS